jgi:predicted transcriptional regulator
MKTETPYISSSVAVKGINDSTLAKSETNDCVVRAFASAFNLSYDFAHKKVAELFGRKNGQGTYSFSLVMRQMEVQDVRINRKKIKTISKDVNLSYWIKVKGVNVLRSMTTAKFLEDYPKGTYIVTVKGHAFTIKDGVVIGNPEDATQRKKNILGAWKIG